MTQPPASAAGFAQVGGYLLQFDGLNVTNSNFNQAVMVGALTVMPKVVNDAYTLEPYTKPFDGNTSLVGFEVDATAVLRGDVFLADDVQLLSDGRYDTPAVGTDKMVTVTFALTGSDANNYRLATPVFAGAVGTITSIDPIEPKPPKPPQPPALNITDGLAGESLQQVVEHFRMEQEIPGKLEFDAQAVRQSAVLTQSPVSNPIAGWPCLIIDDWNQLHAQQAEPAIAQRIWLDEHGCEFLDQAIDANR